MGYSIILPEGFSEEAVGVIDRLFVPEEPTVPEPFALKESYTEEEKLQAWEQLTSQCLSRSQPQPAAHRPQRVSLRRRMLAVMFDLPV